MRRVYGLSTVLYCDTETDKNSVVIAVVRHQQDNNFPIKSFQDMKGRTACFPEYAGISWLSFVNTARKVGIISSKSCDYPSLVSKLFSGACTPGIKDRDHSHVTASTDVSTKLCSACIQSNNTSCAANNTNQYYDDKGAMRCLEESAGDVAFVEIENIFGKMINCLLLPFPICTIKLSQSQIITRFYQSFNQMWACKHFYKFLPWTMFLSLLLKSSNYITDSQMSYASIIKPCWIVTKLFTKNYEILNWFIILQMIQILLSIQITTTFYARMEA